MLRTSAAAAGMLALLVTLSARAEGAPTGAPVPAAPATGTQQEQAAGAGGMEVTWDTNPYYTDVDLNIPLTDTPIPTIRSDSEAVIYRDLIEGSLVPRFMLLEASVYPMPVLGTYIKSHDPGLYREGEISHTGVNVIESATAGFQEPWALSAFFGNIANLERPGKEHQSNNLGYTGYLVSAGAQHIKDNVLIQDKWYEVEWKIKGDLNDAAQKLSWSFRVGGKFNANPDITDVMYLGIHRNNLDFNQPFLSWFKNSDVDLQLSFSQHGGQVVREQLVFGKKYPFPENGFSLTLDVGFVWDSPNEYSGVLRTDNSSSLTLVLRPGIEF
ncbi:MAG TPA: hypothetical protein VHP13_07925 [Gammaproteobacteria bacterium]|jgi:hypothetical protein|nr:hypothetical protein [Gammaproteobacteria bacterium]